MSLSDIRLDDSYAHALPEGFIDWPPAQVAAARLIFLNTPLAEELGLALSSASTHELVALFSGQKLPAGARPIAQAYAGHQFGHFSPQLGDGRALLIGELVDIHGQRRDLAYKGSGPTPFSRGGDGLAALGPMLREALISEAMHALGIPTSRALAVVATGTTVQREQPLPGAMLTRIAASHLRVGSFEYFAARNDRNSLRRLADYAIARHEPDLQSAPQPYLAFLQAVINRQAELIARWQCAGFIHGVMNTDNMSIAGETLDYGPCAFMESTAPQTVYSSIDVHGRYAYGNQPACAQWNLARLAETLLPLLADDHPSAVELATNAVTSFGEHYQRALLGGWRAKLGLQKDTPEDSQQDESLATDWLQLLHQERIDFTLAWRHLSAAAQGEFQPLQALFAKQDNLAAWLRRWKARCQNEDASTGKPAALAQQQRAQAMRAANPWLIPRNQAVETALNAATHAHDLAPFEQLLHALRHPYEEQPLAATLAQPSSASFMANYRTFCGT